jgi:general secretion pathway protein N
VLITPTLQMAIFTDNKDASSRRAKLGEMVTGSNWRLAVLEPRRAVLEGPSGQRELGLRVFDGKGGQAPTPVATASPTSDGDGAVRDANAVPPPPPQVGKSPPPAPDVASQPVRTEPRPESAAPPPMTQEQQVEAIRRRIEARRAQMRAEAAAASREK